METLLEKLNRAAATGNIALAEKLIAELRATGGNLGERSFFDGRIIDPKDKFKGNLTPLGLAAKYGHPNIVSLLLKNGAPVDDNSKNDTPLARAIEHQYLKYPVYFGTLDTEIKRKERPDILQNKLLKVANILLEHGADPNAYSVSTQLFCPLYEIIENNYPILNLAAKMGNIDLVQRLIDTKKVKLNAKGGSRGNTALLATTNDTIVKKLIKAGANVNSKSKENDIFLISIVRRPKPNMSLVKAVITHPDIQLNVTDRDGYNVLYYVDDPLITRMLFENGAKIKIRKGSMGNSPLAKHLHQFYIEDKLSQDSVKDLAALHIEFGERDNLNFEHYRHPPLKRILAIPTMVKELLEKPDLKKIKAESENLETGELFRKNFAARSKRELNTRQYLLERYSSPNITNNFIDLIEKELITPVQFANLLIQSPQQKINIPERCQKQVENLVVDSLTKNGVPVSSVPEYIESISNNFPFLKKPLDKLRMEAFSAGAMVLYTLSQVTDPEVQNIDLVKKAPALLATFGEKAEEEDQKAVSLSKEVAPIPKELHPPLAKESTPLAKAEREKYEEDPSLFLKSISQAIEILVQKAKNSNVATEFDKFKITENIGLLESIITPNKKLFKCLGTSSQIQTLRNKIPSIRLLYAKAKKFRNKLGQDKAEKYEGILDEMYNIVAQLPQGTFYKGKLEERKNLAIKNTSPVIAKKTRERSNSI